MRIENLVEKESVQRLLNRHGIPLQSFLLYGYTKVVDGEIVLYMKHWKKPISHKIVKNYKIGETYL